MARAAVPRVLARRQARVDDYVTDGKRLYLVLADGRDVNDLKDGELLLEDQASFKASGKPAARLRVVGHLG